MDTHRIRDPASRARLQMVRSLSPTIILSFSRPISSTRAFQSRIDCLVLIFIARDLFRTSGEWPITVRENRTVLRELNALLRPSFRFVELHRENDSGSLGPIFERTRATRFSEGIIEFSQIFSISWNWNPAQYGGD